MIIHKFYELKLFEYWYDVSNDELKLFEHWYDVSNDDIFIQK